MIERVSSVARVPKVGDYAKENQSFNENNKKKQELTFSTILENKMKESPKTNTSSAYKVDLTNLTYL